ncbi:MAG: hypothetical protein GAK28_01782 [Luteibacter sp.]|uniref:hypothetical protein n=1 Tax=Luteibacter sp. TaxID=1886636 RepID=UPI001384DEDA|nr:hypothetical protein [Luteibacter sp.]KAF1007440.1 MAG: hypothetical protein GAK28_01782 [Luteibacter sp.]
MPTTRYRSVLPISYMVPTLYPTAPGAVKPLGGAPLIQFGDPDLQARAQRLVNVLYWTAMTYANHDGMQDNETLKVFMAPEFYFRKASNEDALRDRFISGADFGSYTEHSRYMLAEALYDAIARSPLFKDWTIVAGSICSALPRATDARLNLLNTAIVLRGRRAVHDSSIPYALLEKHYISTGENVDSRSHADRDPTTTYSFRLNPDKGMDNIISWDEMCFGLEVCLDHGMQVVRNNVTTLRQVMGPTVAELDLQLVTSCGMSIVGQAVAVKNGALVMLTDGMSYADDNLPEPTFQVGRYDAATHQVNMIGRDQFVFTELPKTSDYQVLQYARGRYADLSRRQGVWVSNDRLPLIIN